MKYTFLMYEQDILCRISKDILNSTKLLFHKLQDKILMQSWNWKEYSNSYPTKFKMWYIYLDISFDTHDFENNFSQIKYQYL